MNGGFYLKQIFRLFILTIVFFGGERITFAQETHFTNTNVPIDKVWTISFSEDIDSRTINHETIYIRDSYGDSVHVRLQADFFNRKQVKVTSSASYKFDSEYYLHMTDGIKSISGKSLNYHTTMKFTTVKNPNLGDLTKITTATDLSDYLNTNFSVLDTPVGKWEMKYTVRKSLYNHISIVTSWRGGSPYTLHNDDDGLETLEYGRAITNEEAIATKQALRRLQKEIANISLTVFPNTAIDGGFYAGGYEYPNLQVGYWSVPFLSWKNYYGNSYDTTDIEQIFHWNPKGDDYNFVLDTPIKKIYVVDSKNNRQFAYRDNNATIKIKKGEKIQFAFDQEVDPILTNFEIGISYTDSDYSKKNIIQIDKKGNIIGNKAGQQNISVNYYWDPYVYHYFTIIVED